MKKASARPNQAARKQLPDLTPELFNSKKCGEKQAQLQQQQQRQRRVGSSEGKESAADVAEVTKEVEETKLEEKQVDEPQMEAPPAVNWNKRWEEETSLYAKCSAIEDASPFDASSKQEKLPNPFANRRRLKNDVFEKKMIPKRNSRGFDNLGPPNGSPSFVSTGADLSDSFSAMSVLSPKHVRSTPRADTNVVLPAWWKTRSFSSASCFYPQNVKSQNRSLTTLNVPSHGHLDDIETYLTPNVQTVRKPDFNAKKERWARLKAKKKILRRPMEDEYFNDADAEEEIMNGRGVMLNQIIQQGTSGQYEDADLLRKYRRDVAFVKEQLMKEVDGNLDAIRELRFLIASVQTYGNIDGQCMMAEMAMNEFTLFAGVLERFHAIVGPWTTENETQRRRASRHAFDTHKIPLQHNFATISKRKLVEEILGRSEPTIAYRQGVKVGLYSDTCDEQFRVHLHIKNSFKDAAMLVDSNDRRFILVLQNELDLMIDSMKHLAKTVGLQYEGFPILPDRYVIVEAFVEAISELIGETIAPDTMRWFGILGQKAPEDSTTPWEKNVDLHCSRHSDPHNNFCAQVIVCRATFIILHVLGSFFRRYHLRKIPLNMAASANPIISQMPNLLQE